MVYTCKYKSSIGDILLATDEIGLIGLWFEGQKYFTMSVSFRVIMFWKCRLGEVIEMEKRYEK